GHCLSWAGRQRPRGDSGLDIGRDTDDPGGGLAGTTDIRGRGRRGCRGAGRVFGLSRRLLPRGAHRRLVSALLDSGTCLRPALPGTAQALQRDRPGTERGPGAVVQVQRLAARGVRRPGGVPGHPRGPEGTPSTKNPGYLGVRSTRRAPFRGGLLALVRLRRIARRIRRIAEASPTLHGRLQLVAAPSAAPARADVGTLGRTRLERDGIPGRGSLLQAGASSPGKTEPLSGLAPACDLRSRFSFLLLGARSRMGPLSPAAAEPGKAAAGGGLAWPVNPDPVLPSVCAALAAAVFSGLDHDGKPHQSGISNTAAENRQVHFRTRDWKSLRVQYMGVDRLWYCDAGDRASGRRHVALADLGSRCITRAAGTLGLAEERRQEGSYRSAGRHTGTASAGSPSGHVLRGRPGACAGGTRPGAAARAWEPPALGPGGPGPVASGGGPQDSVRGAPWPLGAGPRIPDTVEPSGPAGYRPGCCPGRQVGVVKLPALAASSQNRRTCVM